jgi:para-nitrobenzyl esterase
MWAVAQASSGKAPVFVYKFEHRPPVPPDFGAKRGMLGPPGAYHGAELPYLFGSFASYPDWTLAPVDLQISRGIQAYWVRFVSSGDPNGASNLPAWPRYAGEDFKQLRIDSSGFRVMPDSDRDRFAKLARLAAAVPGSLSYRDMHAEQWAP